MLISQVITQKYYLINQWKEEKVTRFSPETPLLYHCKVYSHIIKNTNRNYKVFCTP